VKCSRTRMRYSAKLSTLEFLNIRWSLNFYTLYFWIVLSLLRLPSGIDTCGQPGSSFFVNRSSSRPDCINCRVLPSWHYLRRDYIEQPTRISNMKRSTCRQEKNSCTRDRNRSEGCKSQKLNLESSYRIWRRVHIWEM
jgi:hypothetical protein